MDELELEERSLKLGDELLNFLHSNKEQDIMVKIVALSDLADYFQNLMDEELFDDKENEDLTEPLD